MNKVNIKSRWFYTSTLEVSDLVGILPVDVAALMTLLFRVIINVSKRHLRIVLGGIPIFNNNNLRFYEITYGLIMVCMTTKLFMF